MSRASQLGVRAMYRDQDEMKEGVQEVRMSVDFKDSDKKLVDTANEWIAEAMPLHKLFLNHQKKNERYWLGDQLRDIPLDQYQSRMVLNKVFQNLETLIPIITRNLPAPVASLKESEDNAEDIDRRRYANDIEDIILSVAQENGMSKKLEEFVRFQQLYYLGVLKYGYDEDDGIWVEVVRPQRIMVSPFNSLDYVIEYHEDTVGELIEMFQDKEKEIKDKLLEPNKSGGRAAKNFLNTTVGYYEVTTDEMTFWKVGGILLGKEENPNYDFKNKKNNFWKKPKKNYIFSDLWRLEKNPYSQTTLVDQTIVIQDGINQRKRQISDNNDRANGVLIGYGNNGVTKDECAKIEAGRKRPNAVVHLEKATQGSLQDFKGAQANPQIMEDMLHSEAEMDNVFGIHATTRGEKTPGEIPFRGLQLLSDNDVGRHSTITSMVEKAAEELYNAFAQMIRKHYTKPHYNVFLGSDGTSRHLKIEKEVIKDGLSLKVREGTTLHKDKAIQAQEALVLWQNKAIDLVSLYERLGDPNPYRTAERTFLFQTAPEKLFAQIAQVLEKTKKSDTETMILLGVIRAGFENKALSTGQNVPPFVDATPQHIAVHQELMQSEEYLQLPFKVRQVGAAHLQAELDIVKRKLVESQDLNKKQKAEVEESFKNIATQ